MHWLLCSVLFISSITVPTTDVDKPQESTSCETKLIEMEEQMERHYYPYYYTFPERLLRLFYFRLAVRHEESWMYEAAEFICNLFKFDSWNSSKFSEEKSRQNLEIFKKMGAKEFYIPTSDCRGIVHGIVLQAKDLEEKILSYGGAWQKIQQENFTYYVVLPPDNFDDNWEDFTNECLSRLGWVKHPILLPDGIQRLGFITSENANLIKAEDQNPFCFLHCHPNSDSFSDYFERAGFYLGMKQDLCFFDQRGVGFSKGVASEEAYYLDIEAVYEHLKREYFYEASKLWASGFCAGTPIAGYLKLKLHEEGVNFISEQGFVDLLKDFVGDRDFFVRWLGERSLGGLESPDIAKDFPGRPRQYQLSIDLMWKNLPFEKKGKVIIIHSLNDKLLPPEISENMAQVARRVNEKVDLLLYFSKKENPHIDFFYLYPDLRKKFIELVFGQTSEQPLDKSAIMHQ